MKRRWLFIGFVLTALLMGTMLLTSYERSSDFQATSRSVIHTQEVLVEVESILSTLQDIETGERGYAITGDGRFLEPYLDGIGQVKERLERGKQLTADNPQQQDRFNRLKSLVAQHIAIVDRIIDARKNEGFEAIQSLVRAGEEKDQMDQIRRLISEMMLEERTLLRIQTTRFEDRASTALALITLGSLLTMIMVFLSAMVAARQLRERDETLARLRASEGRYRNIFETTGVSIWEENFSQVKAAIDDLKARGVQDLRRYLAAYPEFVRQSISMVKIIDVNNATVKLFAAQSKDELLVSLHKIFLPETQEVFVEELIAVAEGRTYFEQETVLQTIKGDKLSVLFTMTLQSEPADLGRVLVSVMDITERKQAEEALRDSEARLSLAQKSAGAGVWDWDLKSGRMNWSEEYFRLLGLKPGERQPSHENWLRCIYPDDRPRAEGMVEEALKEKRELALEFRIIRPDGEIRWLSRRGRAFADHDGQPSRMIGITLDITGRKRTEALLMGEKRLLEMNASGESLISILEKSCLVIDELSGNFLSSILLLDPNSNRLRHAAAPNLPKSYCEAIDGVAIGSCVGSCGTAAYRREEVVVSDIATDSLWADYRDLALAHGLRACWSIPILSLEGKKVLGTFAVYRREPFSPCSEERDIIERITSLVRVTLERSQVTEALRNTQAELAHATRIMTMGEMTASIAHEVNQPLAAVITNGNACLRWLTNRSPNLDEALEAVRHIIRDGNRASDVIARIRALSRKTVAEKVRLDLNGIIQEVVAFVRSEIRKQRVVLRTELAGDLPPVLGDAVELQQLMLNLIMNGVEAMRAIEGRPRELVVSTQNGEADRVRVTVQDSGIGLDPQNLERIFDAFYTTKREGLGMGLTICRSIVEKHGGRLWVAPNAGPGATFQFTLSKFS